MCVRVCVCWQGIGVFTLLGREESGYNLIKGRLAETITVHHKMPIEDRWVVDTMVHNFTHPAPACLGFWWMAIVNRVL